MSRNIKKENLTFGEKVNKAFTYLIIFLFLAVMPIYVLYDIIIAPFIEDVKSVKIEKEDFLNVDLQEKDFEIDSSEIKIDTAIKVPAPIMQLPLRGENDDTVAHNLGFSYNRWIKINKKIAGIPHLIARREKDKQLERALDSIAKYNRKFSGKLKGEKVTILITGLDTRLGTNTSHADANHLLTIYFESGFIQIISVPRGTYADAGNIDTAENYLANVRSSRGRRIYQSEVSRITGVSKIDYYVEFGFSQAIGLMELMGYKSNAVQMLRMLRHRKSFSGGDVQRCYNQGQFIRQMILGFFPILDGVSGDVILRAALYLVKTDLDISTVKQIIQKLCEHGFPRGRSDVMVTLKPMYRAVTNEYDFTSDISRDSLYKRLSNFAQKIGLKEKAYDAASHSEDVYKKLTTLLKEVGKLPSEKIIEILDRLFEQRIWFQVIDLPKRAECRDKIGDMLIDAYKATGNKKKAEEIKKEMEEDKELLNK
jgi:hypothetical protein